MTALFSEIGNRLQLAILLSIDLKEKKCFFDQLICLPSWLSFIYFHPHQNIFLRAHLSYHFYPNLWTILSLSDHKKGVNSFNCASLSFLNSEQANLTIIWRKSIQYPLLLFDFSQTLVFFTYFLKIVDKKEELFPAILIHKYFSIKLD